MEVKNPFQKDSNPKQLTSFIIKEKFHKGKDSQFTNVHHLALIEKALQIFMNFQNNILDHTNKVHFFTIILT